MNAHSQPAVLPYPKIMSNSFDKSSSAATEIGVTPATSSMS